MENYIYKTLATCPSTAKTVGDTVRLTVNITQGTSPYTITYMKDSTQIISPVTAATIGTYYYDYVTLPTDIGTPTFSVNVVDSCSPTPYTFTDSCVVTINTACPPPSCDFTWSPANPTTDDIISVTTSDTTLTTQEYIMNGLTIATGSFTMQLGVAGNYDLTHTGINSCNSTCTMTKTITVTCLPTICSFTVI